MVIQKHTDVLLRGTISDLETHPDFSDFILSQKIELRLFGCTYLGQRMENGWSSTLPYYAFICKKHGIQYGYPTGFSKTLLCPECIRSLQK